MKHLIKLRTAQKRDDPFIFSLSPYLAEVAQLSWHTEDVINKMQYDYIAEMLKETSVPHITYIADIDNTPSGFIHIRTQHDSISGESRRMGESTRLSFIAFRSFCKQQKCPRLL